MGLALGTRISDFHSLLRGDRYIRFARNYRYVTILPNPHFLSKNETPIFRRQPMIVNALLKRDGSHHPLCPVMALHNYLVSTQNTNSNKLFVNPVSGAPCNKGRIAFYFLSLVRSSQPEALAGFHDLRKFAAWQAFWDNMSWSSLRARGFWRSNSALGRRYLQGSFPSVSRCVALGRASHQ